MLYFKRHKYLGSNRSKRSLGHFLTLCLVVGGCGTEFSSKKIKNKVLVSDPEKYGKEVGSRKPGQSGQSGDPVDPSLGREPDGKDSRPIEPTDSVEPIPKPEIKITGLDPYRYQAEVNWSERFKNVSIYANGALVFKSNSKTVTNCFFDLQHNKEYKIEVYSRNENLNTKGATTYLVQSPDSLKQRVEADAAEEGREIQIEWLIKTPLDVIIDQESFKQTLSLAESNRTLIIKAHRVFINPQSDSKLFIEDKDIFISTDELYSNNAVIATFLAGQKALPEIKGRAGGTLNIKALQAYGELSLELRGEEGGDGINGKAYLDRAPNGTNGESGYSEWSEGGHMPHFSCSKDPTNGRPGSPGANGNGGTNGKKGGDSGFLTLEISEKSPEFKVSVLKEYGKTGKIGVGSEGQLGGIGGNPGASSSKCRSALAGPDGTNGIKGSDGIAEGDGLIQNDCISIGEGFGRCAN